MNMIENIAVNNMRREMGNSGTELVWLDRNVLAESSNNCEFLSMLFGLDVRSNVYWFPLSRKYIMFSLNDVELSAVYCVADLIATRTPSLYLSTNPLYTIVFESSL